MVRVAGTGTVSGWVMLPPVSKDEADRAFGTKIPDEAWRNIRKAFAQHGQRMDELNATRYNKNRNNKQGWHRRKRDAEKGLDAAFAGLSKINRDFLREVEEIASLERSGGLESYKCISRLDRALDEINFLSWVLQNADPDPRDIVTKAESHKMLAKEIYETLKPYGATLSNGWRLEQGTPSYDDLTNFERLAETLEIHQGATPKATSKWLREATAQDRCSGGT
jgi:hypothetical protein